ncbi:hypothetical protein CCACVL1_07524 [Corchorus capsularis]|uniref:Uncharacterized protein n=1 Tax=Corchorus capsularis TaxID=210143 RepID=A0A1R3J5I8_COCAP|nr:hypothetical protein CCACVL1_07524 [Corchorus capsularis]
MATMLAKSINFTASLTAAAARRRPATTTGGGGGSMKQCLCSPTKHPGSFRCRHHQGEYVWGGRFVGKK